MRKHANTSGPRPAMPEIQKAPEALFAGLSRSERFGAALDMLRVTQIALGNDQAVSDGGNLAMSAIVGMAVSILYDLEEEIDGETRA